MTPDTQGLQPPARAAKEHVEAFRLARKRALEAHERAHALHLEAAELFARHAEEMNDEGRPREARIARKRASRETRQAEEQAEETMAARQRLAEAE